MMLHLISKKNPLTWRSRPPKAQQPHHWKPSNSAPRRLAHRLKSDPCRHIRSCRRHLRTQGWRKLYIPPFSRIDVEKGASKFVGDEACKSSNLLKNVWGGWQENEWMKVIIFTKHSCKTLVTFLGISRYIRINRTVPLYVLSSPHLSYSYVVHTHYECGLARKTMNKCEQPHAWIKETPCIGIDHPLNSDFWNGNLTGM